jgi:hypothetical protein
MTVLCVHSVLETSATAAGFARRSVREGGIDGPSQHKSLPAGNSPPASQPGGPPCRVISLAFGLIGQDTIQDLQIDRIYQDLLPGYRPAYQTRFRINQLTISATEKAEC